VIQYLAFIAASTKAQKQAPVTPTITDKVHVNQCLLQWQYITDAALVRAARIYYRYSCQMNQLFPCFMCFSRSLFFFKLLDHHQISVYRGRHIAASSE